MLQLVDYHYYFYEYYGDSSIPESSFNNLSIKATTKVNLYTFNRINKNNIDDNIRNTVCEITELLFEQQKLKEKLNDNTLVKASETVGPHSVNYVNKTNLQLQKILSSKELDKECYKICYEHLADTGLMHGGID